MEFSATAQSEEETAMDVKRGPWTVEEDLLLMNYVNAHGEGRWNSLAHFAGLRRTGKSCRLRWLNYLRPDVRRGNITPEEQLLILELHSRWGNRWSKIAQHLPGRTDNEIKNYWRTRVQKHAKQLKCDVNSKRFKDAVRYVWMPRLAERIRAAGGGGGGSGGLDASAPAASHGGPPEEKPGSENSSATDSPSWDSAGMQFSPPLAASDGFSAPGGEDSRGDVTQLSELEDFWWEETFPSLDGYADLGFLDLDQNMWTENHWSAQDPWPLQQQF